VLEFLRELTGMLFGSRPDSRLPDCKSILFIIKANKMLDSRSASRYVALCRLTAVALFLRWFCILLLARTAVLIFLHNDMKEIAISCVVVVAVVVVFNTLARLATYLASEYSPEALG
jgi:hypothetical protein